ncbi:MAG: hypothetical protein HYR55_12555, partial [Acidobacteria bacterium]|nr:hypothetical protein [Acidobacteriota bacterium]
LLVAQVKKDEEKPKPAKAGAGSSALREDRKPRPPKVRGTPLGSTKSAPEKTDRKSAVIPDRTTMPAKPLRRILVTDLRGREIELTDFQLGSAGVWEYGGLRIRKLTEAARPEQKKPSPTGKGQAKERQQRLQERLARKRVNHGGPDPRRTTLARDTVVKWDTIKEANLSRNKNSKALYAKITTKDNKLIEGPLNVSSDYLIGTKPDGRDYVVRLRNVSHIAFSADPAESSRKPVLAQSKPHVGSIKRGSADPKKMQPKILSMR